MNVLIFLFYVSGIAKSLFGLTLNWERVREILDDVDIYDRERDFGWNLIDFC